MTANFRLSAMALALSAAWPALAQQAPATAPASEDESQRVVITANKRAEIAAQAFTAKPESDDEE